MSLAFGYIFANSKLENMSFLRDFWVYGIIWPNSKVLNLATWGQFEPFCEGRKASCHNLTTKTICKAIEWK